jgi:hypothetical protein
MHSDRSLSSLFRSVLLVALLGGATGCPGPKPDPDCENQPKGCEPSSNQDAGNTTDSGTHTPTDSGTGSGDAGQDAGTVDPATTLVVTQVISHYNRKGIEAVPRDFSQSPAELFVLDGGVPVKFQGTAVAPGRMHFNVPPGEYFVKSSDTVYVLTTARTVDLGYRRFGRPDRGGNTVPVPTPPHPASLELSGLAPSPVPIEQYDYTLLFGSMDLEESGSFELSQPIAAGQTTVVDRDAGYYTDWGSIPRYDPAQGDTAWVYQTMSHDAGVPADGGQPYTYRTIVRAAHLNPFAFDGGTLTIKATLQPVPQQEVLFEWRRDDFNALRSASLSGNPSAINDLTLYPTLKDARDGWVDYSVSSLLSFLPPSNDAQTLLVRRFTYGNPFPAGWEPTAEFTSVFFFTLTNHDGTRTVRASEQFLVNGPLGEITSAPVRPQLSLPQDFRVDGLPATTARLMGTTTPMVTWGPSTLGLPTRYTLQVLRLTDSNRLTNVARIHIGYNFKNVRLPFGLLTPGNTYVLRLTARRGPEGMLEQPLLQYVTPYATASTVSGLLTVP